MGVRRALWVLVGRLEEKSKSEDLGVDGRIMFKWTLKKSVGRGGLD
jgi:hypothetical protein